jgi:hypothetical protein
LNQAGTVQRQSLALRGRTGQGLAHRPHAAASGSAAAGGRPRNTYIVSGNGDVIEPDNEIAAIGSGGPFAKSAATALMRKYETERARDRRKSMTIAAKTCIYTNENVIYEELG